MGKNIQKDAELDKVFKNVQNCTECSLCKNRIKSVFAKGNENAKIMLIGEAPGKQENEDGLPFVGQSGKILNKLLTEAGFAPENDIYFCNVVKCRPVRKNENVDKQPTKKQMQACLGFLNEQIKIINPEIIILCGKTAVKAFNIKGSLNELHGKCINKNGLKLFPIYHPRASITNDIKRNDFIKIKKCMN